MAEESKKNKGLIIGVCVAVVVVIAIVIAIVLGLRGGLNDSYFVSDDTKYVLNMDADEMAFDDEEHTPSKVHLVYTYEGDSITGLKAYYEYEDASSAKDAFEYVKEAEADSYKNITLDGKFIILEANESEYQNITPEDVKQQIEFMEMLKNLDTSDDTDEEYIEDENVEESGEEETTEETDIVEDTTVEE